MLDANGNKIGVPVKSSLLNNKPGLKFLQAKFLENESMKQRYNQRIKNIIDFALFKKSDVSLTTLTDALKKEGIDCVLRTSKEGFIYGITYIDHRNKCVFNGSDLGKQYSAKGIQERCVLHPSYQQSQTHNLTTLFELQN